MTDGAWPVVRLPAPMGPAAAEHLQQIRKAAQRANSANLRDIEEAIAACLDRKCLQGGNSRQRGRAPRDDDHGASVLLARAYAAESNWDGCLFALRHGEAPPDQTRKSKAPGP